MYKLKYISVALFALQFISFSAWSETFPEKQARNNGVRTCLPAVKKIAEFLIGDTSNYGAFSTSNNKNADKHIFISRIERTFSKGYSELNTFYVAPTTSGLCSAAYERITYWPDSCLKVAKDTFKEFEYKGEINAEITHLSKNGQPMFLMNAGNGCVSIRQEVVYDGNNP